MVGDQTRYFSKEVQKQLQIPSFLSLPNLQHLAKWAPENLRLILLNIQIITVKKDHASRSVVSNFGTPWTVVRQAPLSMGFSRQEYWSGLPFSSPGKRRPNLSLFALHQETGNNQTINMVWYQHSTSLLYSWFVWQSCRRPMVPLSLIPLLAYVPLNPCFDQTASSLCSECIWKILWPFTMHCFFVCGKGEFLLVE